MSLEQKRDASARPRRVPDESIVSSVVAEPENLKEAKLLEQHEDNTAVSGETEALQDKKSASSKKPKIGALTDVDAISGYLTRIQAEPRSLKTAVISEQEGKYRRDIATVHFEKDGTVSVKLAYHAAAGTDVEALAPTEAEAAEIKAEVAGYAWPAHKIAYSLAGAPDAITKAAPENVFKFEAADGGIIMIQVRIETETGKVYKPWTYWDDGEWRCAEPEGLLPLYNGHRLREASTVFIHEGAKAARHAQWLADGKTHEAEEARKAHPWGADMTGVLHVGWIGGALSPERTDWSAFKRAGIETVFIVADNDDPGKRAIQKIAEHVRCETFSVEFTKLFPLSFDLADQFPEKLYDKDHHYTGPSFKECVHPATWATDMMPNPEGKGRPVAVLRDSIKGQWFYIEETEVYVSRKIPGLMRTPSQLNNMLAPFSHVSDTSRLLLKHYQGRSVRLCYNPGVEEIEITGRGSSAVNMHVPSTIREKSGDVAPFLEFLAYLFPNDREQKEIERWCATLIARPKIRMGYAVLIASEKQGVGKTTLGASILAPLIGEENVSYPGENTFSNGFNQWMVNKRLVVINEIYAGASWKIYNALKGVITDKEIEVNQKHVKQYTIDNWIHVFACSNSMNALKIAKDDRRWFAPEVNEVPWPKERFAEFRAWLEGGGLGIIKSWATSYGDYVDPGAHAPMTERKLEMIESSRSEAQKEAVAVALAMLDPKMKPVAVTLKEVAAHVRSVVEGKVFDTDLELRKAMTDAGAVRLKKRLTIKKRSYEILVNPALAEELKGVEDCKEWSDAVREKILNVRDFIEPPI